LLPAGLPFNFCFIFPSEKNFFNYSQSAPPKTRLSERAEERFLKKIASMGQRTKIKKIEK